MDFTAKKMLPKDWQKIIEEMLIHQQSSNVRSTQHDKDIGRLIGALANNDQYQKNCIVEEQAEKIKGMRLIAKVIANNSMYYYDRTAGLWYSGLSLEKVGVVLPPELFDCGKISSGMSARGGKCFIDKANKRLEERYKHNAGATDGCVALGCKHRDLGSPAQQTLMGAF